MYADELTLKIAIVDRITYDLSVDDLAALHDLFIGEWIKAPDSAAYHSSLWLLDECEEVIRNTAITRPFPLELMLWDPWF